MITLWSHLKQLWNLSLKNLGSGLNGIRSHDLCDTGAVLYQLSYQAIWELVTLWVRNITVEGEELLWLWLTRMIYGECCSACRRRIGWRRQKPNQRGLSPVPSGRQTYRAWKERQVAQVADRISRPGCIGKRPAHWQAVCQQVCYFRCLAWHQGCSSKSWKRKADQWIGLHLLCHAGAIGELRRRAFEGFTHSG